MTDNIFKLTSDITIGTFRWRGLNHVRITRSIHSYGDTCVIRIPSLGKVYKDSDKSTRAVTTADLFNDPWKIWMGQKVVVKLGYNGWNNLEFEGFVKRCNLGVELEVECEGYGRQLRLHQNISGFYKDTSAAKLLALATKGTDIKVVCPDDVPMHNIRLIKANGAQIVDEIKKVTLGSFSVFFLRPNVLWCGLTYLQYTRGKNPYSIGSAKYRLGWNCPKENELKVRQVTEPVQIILNGTLATGQAVMTASEGKYAVNKEQTTQNNIQDIGWLKKIAQEKEFRANYVGYEGAVTGFGVPYVQPGFELEIRDTRYKKNNGIYIADGVDVEFGVRGFRRKTSVGPLIKEL